MRPLLYIFFLVPFLGFTGASQESTRIEALNLHQNFLQPPQTTDLDLAVSITNNKTITEISSSIIKAETWLKTNVLSRYPSTKITTIVIFLPHSPQTTQHNTILSSLKNLHHSLTRWGLQNNIKVSTGFSYQSLNNLETFKAVLNFLKSINSTLTINNYNHLDLLHSIENLGSLTFNKVNFLNPKTEQSTTTNPRRNLRSLLTIHLPTSPELSPTSSPFTFPPELSPLSNPTITLPPCVPSPAPSPVKKKDMEGLWCVAKPSVAAETLQQALDFACGQGGANCDEIKPHGICYYPDTAVAHASYAFNSYWQKNKRSGGTCSFGGTAMLITTDPSYQHCRFVLS